MPLTSGHDDAIRGGSPVARLQVLIPLPEDTHPRLEVTEND